MRAETLDAHVVLTEALGSEIVVHFETDITKVVTEDTKLLAEESGEADVAAVGHDRTKWVASFAPRSRVRPRDEIKVVVDTERLHFFDATTSDAINR